ncbi:H-2 class I histocompatibility antigen, Q10 alpha chain isoform X2 [Pteropus alecto]|uniref:H-2 class I histocompatibility antigen, Q10 alpha chain isoform X2 n=1 Tax=Pteropus alecto TaxID=9402 RepID=UPI0007685ADE|nr:H-2 class I histocompatibility antigen, Q10 alpha chain isoform X2 [Pteropus alecto]
MLAFTSLGPYKGRVRGWMAAGIDTKPRAPQLKRVSARTSALRQPSRLAARGRRGPGCAPLLLLLLLLELVWESASESPWGLPVVADGPASLAKVMMAELASLKLENKPWPGGTHSLRYHYLALSEPGPGLPQFLAVGYVDDHPFIRYDSRVGRAEPQARWMAPVDAQYWETETQKQRAWAEVQQVETWTVMGYRNHTSGMHSTQRMFGCNIQEDGRSSSFWQFGFDGQDHLSLDLETLSWVSAEPMAMRTKRWWELERCYAEYDKAYLEGLCLTSLRRYLELGGQHLTRKEPPTVYVTRHSTEDRGTTLRCWALGFYPRDISLRWWLGEEELALETEHVETRPSGDGTYQMWAAVRVPAGEEAGYTCHVQHSGLNHTLTVAWEPPSRHGLTAMVISSILLLLAVGVVILTKRFLQARNKESYKQAPDGEEPP